MRALVLLVLLAGAIGAQTGEPEPKGTIRGVVKDSFGAPVSGLVVDALTFLDVVTISVAGRNMQLSSGMPAKPARSVTDEAGKYALTGLTPATYTVKTERDLESATPRRIKIGAGEEVSLDIVIPANPVISGRVVDEHGEPAAGASVSLLMWEYLAGILTPVVSEPKKTNEDGSYLFDSGLESNRRYYVLVDRAIPAQLTKDEPIEVPTYYPSATRMEFASPVILYSGERQKVDIKIATAPLYCVDGKIQGAGDFKIQEAPLAGTRLVRLHGSPDAHGNYHVCGLPAGSYQLSAARAFTEFTVLDSNLEHVDLSNDLAQLRVKVDWDDSAPAAPKLDTRGKAALRKLAALEGMGDALTDDDLTDLAKRLARPSPGDSHLTDTLFQMLHENSDETAGLLLQLASGNFRLEVSLRGAAGRSLSINMSIPSVSQLPAGLPAGDYTLGFSVHGNFTTYPKEMTYNNVRLTDGILRVAPGEQGTLHLVMATDVANIVVNVADSEGKPVPGATVILIRQSVASAPSLSRLSVRGQTDQNGSYISPALTPGKYRVLATTQALRWTVPEDLERVLLVLFQAKDVEVAPNGAAQITLEPIAIY
jgi:hypothetical protein